MTNDEIKYCSVCEIYLFDEELESGICWDCYVKYFEEADYAD